MKRVSLEEVNEILSKDDPQKQEDHKSEDEKLEQYYCLLCKQSIWDDLVSALYDVRFIAPIVALFAMFLAYHITVAPYRVHVETSAYSSSPADLNMNIVRPVISAHKQNQIQRTLLHAETQIELPTLENIRFKFTSSVGEHGNFRLPQMFYHGVTFGLTALNSHDIEHTSFSTLSLDDLENDLRRSLKPSPTVIMRRSVTSNDSLWEENGFAIYYSYSDLQHVGKLSSDAHKPWKRLLENILDLARTYKQAYVTVWYPHAFGAPPSAEILAQESERRRLSTLDASSVSQIPAVKQAAIVDALQRLPPRLTTKPPPPLPTKASSATTSTTSSTSSSTSKNTAASNTKPDEQLLYSTVIHPPHALQHSVLLQEIVPTRTGLDGLKSSSVVWLTAVDELAPHLLDFVNMNDW